MLERSPFLVAYWQADRLLVRNYRTGKEIAAGGAVLQPIAGAARPISRDDLASLGAGITDELIEALLAADLLRQVGGRVDGDDGLDGWRAWLPEAGFFHFSTKDTPFVSASGLVVIGPDPPPSPLKTYPPDAARVALPPAPRDGPLAQTLLQRRTWRRFDEAPLSLEHLSMLAGLTWAVQMWGPGLEDPRLAFKTSPSGGAKHSIEVYVAALRVDGLEAATYHYDPDAHGLVRVAPVPSRQQLLQFLPAQPHYAEAAAVFFMTSVFARVQSKYKFPRAYRVVLLEAGHLAQTFCLLATSLGLAPFCTAALGDTAIEEHLGIDGVGESVLYIAGAGLPPAGVDWAPFADDRSAPQTTPPKHLRDDD